MKKYRNVFITGVVTLVIGLILGYLFFGGNQRTSDKTSEHDHAEEQTQVWTCSMHPQIRQSEPGQCPICGMTLIPLTNNNSEDNADAIQMSSRAMKLADVQTSIVGSGQVTKTLQLTGKVQEDERLIYSQTAHFPGRIEELFVNFTGEYITKGQKIASIYSPDLVTAQEELFEAQKFGNPALMQSAKKKLRSWKLTDPEIEEIVASGKVRTVVPVRADVSGVVIDKKVSIGSHLMEGGVLFQVADLSKVWVVFDAYESDLQWIEKGDSVYFTTPSVPGKTFGAKITFIDPLINAATRVALVRIEVSNTNGLLKPEMLVNGKLVAQTNDKQQDLTIPKSAVMWTGTRSIVYVKMENNGLATFVLREVTLGPALGDEYVIVEGLSSGEEIVTNGTFTIDAAAQLQGKKSMMNPEGGTVNTGHNHGGMSSNTQQEQTMPKTATPKAFKEQLTLVVNQYLSLKDALVNSNLEEANKEANMVLQSLNKINMSLLKGDAHMQWMDLLKPIKAGLEIIKTADSLTKQREAFVTVSDRMAAAVKSFHVTDSVVYVLRCPMADNNKGASWLSNSTVIENPYFGESMLKCGEVIFEIKPNN